MKANLPSVSTFILATADLAAFLNSESGIPIASLTSPPNSFIIVVYCWGTADEPCNTIGNPGILLSISSNISSLNLGSSPGLNLWAPWEVPIAIANESTPVFVTNSSTSSGFVYVWDSAFTSSSIPAKTPNSASTVTSFAWANSTTSLETSIFLAKS